jgi:hypothetical protein
MLTALLRRAVEADPAGAAVVQSIRSDATVGMWLGLNPHKTSGYDISTWE